MSRRHSASAAFERIAIALLGCSCFHEPASDSPTTNDDDATTTSAGASEPMTTVASSADTSSTSSSDKTTETTETSTTMDGCGDDEVELPSVELPWQGPVVIPTGGARAGPCPDDLDAGPRGYTDIGKVGCRCVCADDEPQELCTIRIDTSGDCQLPDEPVRSPCVDVGAEPVRYSIVESSCTATAMPDEDGLAVVQSCELPATSPCAALPPGYRGPCVWSDALSCPPGFPDEIATERIDCAPCRTCNTSAYCAGVEVRTWTEPGCAGTDAAVINFCDESDHASLEFQANGPPMCDATAGALAPLRFCCVPAT